jgi:hypothetical protein
MLTRGFTAVANIRNAPSLNFKIDSVQSAAITIPNLTLGVMQAPGQNLVIYSRINETTKKLLPSPVRQPKELPWELQKALRMYWV